MEVPIQFSNPVAGYLKLSADGRWLYKGEPITHPGLIHILATNYGPGPDGSFEVRLGPQRVTVELADTPYYVTDLDEDPHGLVLVLHDESREPLQADTVCINTAGHAYVTVKDRYRAKFLRKAEILLGRYLLEQSGRLGLRIGNRWIMLQPCET